MIDVNGNILIDKANRSKMLAMRRKYMDELTALASSLCTFAGVDPDDYGLTENFEMFVKRSSEVDRG